MTATRAEVEAAVWPAFPGDDGAAVSALLDLYGTEPHEREREKVQLAIVKLCRGSQEQLAGLVQLAKTDCRDVLCWAQSGPIPEAQLQRQKAMARALIGKWGSKAQ